MENIIIAIIAMLITFFGLRKFFKDSFESSAYYKWLVENDEL